MADVAHQEGNTFYKNGDLDGAEKSYELAYKLDPTEPKYTSNLSAVYYEQGRYILCIDAILNSWRALRVKHAVDGQPRTPPISDSVAAKLSLRFLKAKLNSLAAGLISLHDKKKKQGKTTESNAGIEQDIQTFCDAATQATEGRSQNAELFQTWDMWTKKKEQCEGHTPEECKNGRAEAEKRLRDLLIFRSSLYDANQYFRFGHDIPKSLFFSLDERSVRGDTAINEVTLLKGQQKWKTISFLFGGSGDGRHVYATMIQFTDMWKTFAQYDWTGRDFVVPNLHLTLFDIHPAEIARVMLVFGLVRHSTSAHDATYRTEIEATMFYVWNGIHMPAYCADIVMVVSGEIIKELEGTSPKLLSKLWSVDGQTKSKVLKIFQYWSKPLPKSMETHFYANAPELGNLGTLNIPQSMLQLQASKRDEDYQAMVTVVRSAYGRVNGTRKDPTLPLYNNFAGEDALFQHARILLPPAQLLSRHPALEKYVKSGGKTGKAALREEVIREWKPNPTLFDNHTSENPAYSSGGYPSLSFDEDPSHTTALVLEFLHAFRGADDLSLDQTSFVAIQQLFDSVRQCFAILDPHDGALTLEFVCTELYTGLPKLIAGDFGSRPQPFPRKYLRMWLSNTPDYTGGILSNLVYLAPYLENTKYAAMVWNCLLNPGSFSSLKDMSLNYTYLTASGIRRFFNCALRDDDKGPFDEFNLSILPRTKLYSSVVSKKELHDYLSYILLRALCCPRSGPMSAQVHEPTNLVNFFKLVISLNQTFECPAHWLGDFLQSMINDQLYTSATVFDGVLPAKQKPLPKAAERKINLEPYQLEMENITVTAKGAFPFSISYPEKFATDHGSIRTYTATVEAIVDLPHEVSVTSTTANLLFYKAGFSHGASTLLKLPSRILDLIESQDGKINGIHVQIVSAVEEMDFERNRVSWKMSEAWNDKMKMEGWSMVVWVTNVRRTVSASVPAIAWKEVSGPSGLGGITAA